MVLNKDKTAAVNKNDMSIEVSVRTTKTQPAILGTWDISGHSPNGYSCEG